MRESWHVISCAMQDDVVCILILKPLLNELKCVSCPHGYGAPLWIGMEQRRTLGRYSMVLRFRSVQNSIALWVGTEWHCALDRYVTASHFGSVLNSAPLWIGMEQHRSLDRYGTASRFGWV